MDAVEYIKTLKRICEKHRTCKGCELHNGCACMSDTYDSIEEAVDIVEQWSKDHPVKTRQSEFLKQFPNADLTRLQPCIIEKDKRPTRCIKYIDEVGHCLCDDCRNDYWNEEVTDND